jgi:SAM-dependent methyltransferase
MEMRRTAEEVFDRWALDYHAPGMEDEHWPSVKEAFELIPESNGLYLEVGVGNGYGLFYMATNQYTEGRCLGIDVSHNMVDLAQKRIMGLENVEVRRADFLEFDPGDERPDLIFSMEVFYYFPNISEGIAHAFEILAPGGRVMILVNHYQERPESHDWPSQLETPMQLWSARQYLDAMAGAGFVDVQQKIFGAPVGPEPGTLGTWGLKPSDRG